MRATRLLTSTFTEMLGSYAKLNLLFRSLSANLPEANKAGRLRVARLVALLSITGLAALFPSSAESVNNHTFSSKDYIRSLLSKDESRCLIKLYGKESAFNTKAIGNLSSPSKSYVYGIPQLKNPLIKDMNAYNQIDYGIKYIEHRYHGDTCAAYEHWVKKGWH
jgi:hypothetical protein